MRHLPGLPEPVQRWEDVRAVPSEGERIMSVASHQFGIKADSFDELEALAEAKMHHLANGRPYRYEMQVSHTEPLTSISDGRPFTKAFGAAIRGTIELGRVRENA